MFPKSRERGVRLKIAVICDVLGKENNGTTIAALNLIRSLKAKGHEVRVVCPDACHSGEKGFYIVPRYNFGPFNRYVEKNGVVPGKADEKILEEAIRDADVIHVMTPFSIGKAAALYARAHRIPLTAGFHCQAENVTSHLFLNNFAPGNRLVYRIINKRLYRYCDCIHYPSEFIRQTFEEVVGPTNAYVISNGVNSAFKSRAPKRPTGIGGIYKILFTGRYSPEKSHPILIDAVALSHHKGEIQLVFAGSGPRKDALVKRARERGIRMPVFAFYDRETLIDVINDMDLYVHPAEVEIEAIACLEAIACGLVPLIADSKKSATRFFALTEKNLFTAGDPRDLARKMDWWLDHPDERELCKKKYLGYAKQFDFDRCMDRMEQMLFDAVRKYRRDA